MIVLRNATKIYENNAKGIQDFSLHIPRGEFAFIVGPSGSGKSTLMRLILKELDLTRGEIFVNNFDLSKLTRREIPYYRRKMGMVFQDFKLLENKTIYENVEFAMQIVEASSREIRRTVPSVLSMVGLSKKAKSYPSQLSGGERQRASLARAIVNNPELLIADEPTGNLDPDTAWGIMQILEDINATGTTVIVVSHAKEIVNEMQKRVITLKNGVIIKDVEKGGYRDED